MRKTGNLRKNAKEHQEARLQSEFQINIGEIFSVVEENWKKYDREYLRIEFENALITIHNKYKIISHPYVEDEIDYFKNYYEARYPRALRECKEITSFPFPRFYLQQNKRNDPYPSIVDFDHHFV